MTTYRHDLGAAHTRISHLERELADKNATIARLRTSRAEADMGATESDEAPSSSPNEASAALMTTATTATTTPPAVWDAWPVALLTIDAVVYLAWHGASRPTDAVSLLLVLGAAGFVVLSLGKLLRVRAGGRSSVAQRLLAVLGYALALPLALAVAFVALPFVGTVVGVGSLLVGLIGALGFLFKFIAGKE